MPTSKELNDMIRGKRAEADLIGLGKTAANKVLHGMPYKKALEEQQHEEQVLKEFEKKLDVGTLA